jgi:hypothetical protein
MSSGAGAPITVCREKVHDHRRRIADSARLEIAKIAAVVTHR